MRATNLRICCFGGFAALCVALGGGLSVSTVLGEVLPVVPAKDASLYQYDYSKYVANTVGTYPAADGAGNLHVGDTNNNNGVQRGLVQFDLGAIPSDAIVTGVRLELTVADVPIRILQRDVNFWLVAIEGLADDWVQGPGVEQSPAVPGDATWFHTRYDPTQHGELGNTSGNEFRGFSAGEPGYWPAPGYFGQADLLDTAPGAGAGGLFDDGYALTVPQAKFGAGNVVFWSNDRMLDDVRAWVDGSRDNFGWMLVGEEWITSADKVTRPDTGQRASASSKIDFYSSETAAPYNSPSTLTVTYSRVPEPGTALLLAVAAGLLLAGRWRRWPAGGRA